MRTLAVLLLSAAASVVSAQDYALGPDSQPQTGVPKGVVTTHTLPPGRYYPGTPHRYSIYVPAQYDAAKPTPFMIYMDGSGALGDGQRVPTVFDNLIAKKDLPPMIGIFVDPGVLPVVGPDRQSRFERVFEYDSLSERFSRFLVEELIPAVGANYNLSKNPDDRGLAGVSTGAVAAFVAAWNRPDQFHRVLSFIGTFVAMKGADGLPALIRRTEPKPIRIFLQAGKNDHIVPTQPYGTFFAGSWPVNNRVMLEAFESAGYDAVLEMGEEGHNMRHGAAIMPNALRWLWRDYPTPITVKEPAGMTRAGWDARGKVYSLLSADKPWQRVEGPYASAVSPVTAEDGNTYFSSPTENRIYRVDAAGQVTMFKENTQGAIALAAGPGGRLYASQPGRRRIVSYGPDGDERTVVTNVEAVSIAVTATGAVYYADRKSVASVDGNGRSHAAVGELAQPAAVALSPDQAMLVVGDAQSRFSWSYQIAADGTLINGEPFYRLEMPESGWMSETRGATEDSIGQVYFATALGIQVTEANGRVAMILNGPEPGGVSSVAFGGPGFSWLLTTQNGKLYRRPTKGQGVPPWAPARLPRPPL